MKFRCPKCHAIKENYRKLCKNCGTQNFHLIFDCEICNQEVLCYKGKAEAERHQSSQECFGLGAELEMKRNQFEIFFELDFFEYYASPLNTYPQLKELLKNPYIKIERTQKYTTPPFRTPKYEWAVYKQKRDNYTNKGLPNHKSDIIKKLEDEIKEAGGKKPFRELHHEIKHKDIYKETINHLIRIIIENPNLKYDENEKKYEHYRLSFNPIEKAPNYYEGYKGTIKCPHCKTVLKKSSYKSHTKTMECQMAQLVNEGYQLFHCNTHYPEQINILNTLTEKHHFDFVTFSGKKDLFIYFRPSEIRNEHDHREMIHAIKRGVQLNTDKQIKTFIVTTKFKNI